MKILIIGNGAREYALGYFLKRGKYENKLFFSPGNGGTLELGENLREEPLEEMAVWARDNEINLVIVGPEAYIDKGAGDIFKRQGLTTLAPSKIAARLETSKIFAKVFMKRHDIPTASFKVFKNFEEASESLLKSTFPLVIKADGLAGGKGSFVVKDKTEGFKILVDLLIEKRLKEAGERIIIEDYLEGSEVSVLALCNSKGFVTLLPVQDHKRALEGDLGSNTGGMGAYAPYPLEEGVLESIEKKIIKPTLDGMREEGNPFNGVLYAGLILTKQGPKVIEFNARFGDPEIQVLLPLLEDDLTDLLYAVASEKALPDKLNWKDKKALGIVVASIGYPNSYKIGLSLPKLSERENGYWVHASTETLDGVFVSTGGRVINRVIWADTFYKAREEIIEDLNEGWEGFYYRKDIGYQALREEGKPVRIAILYGSASDSNKLIGLLKLLKGFEVPYISRAISAHRQPEQLDVFIKACESLDIQVYIAAAGLAAHLPGVIASKTLKPVIGIPLDVGSLQGVDALHSICQMPPGIPVATVGVDNVKNAGFLALQILSIKDTDLAMKLRAFRDKWKEVYA